MTKLRVMISSTIKDLKPERQLVDTAIGELRLERMRTESMGSFSRSSSCVCDEMARECDLFVLIIGKRYGSLVPELGISVPEREYQVARESDPEKVLAYEKKLESREPREADFLDRIKHFSEGYFLRPPFNSPKELYVYVKDDISTWVSERIRSPKLKPPRAAEMRKQARGLVRKHEDFDRWLEKSLEANAKETSRIDESYVASGTLHGGPYLRAQFERVRSYERQIKERWLTKVERPTEDFLIEIGVATLGEAACLTARAQQTIALVKGRRGEALTTVRQATLDKLRKMSFHQRDIDQVFETVFGAKLVRPE